MAQHSKKRKVYFKSSWLYLDLSLISNTCMLYIIYYILCISCLWIVFCALLGLGWNNCHSTGQGKDLLWVWWYIFSSWLVYNNVPSLVLMTSPFRCKISTEGVVSLHWEGLVQYDSYGNMISIYIVETRSQLFVLLSGLADHLSPVIFQNKLYIVL